MGLPAKPFNHQICGHRRTKQMFKSNGLIQEETKKMHLKIPFWATQGNIQRVLQVYIYHFKVVLRPRRPMNTKPILNNNTAHTKNQPKVKSASHIGSKGPSLEKRKIVNTKYVSTCLFSNLPQFLTFWVVSLCHLSKLIGR